MGYQGQNGIWQDVEALTLLAPTTFAAAGAVNGLAVEVGAKADATLEFDVTAITAGDTIDAKIQTSKDGTGSGVGAWRDVGSFAQKNAVGTERKSFTGLDHFIRYVVTPLDAGGGGISVTASIRGSVK